MSPRKHHSVRVKNHVVENILASIFGASLITALSTAAPLFIGLTVVSLIGLIYADRADIEEEETKEKNA